MAALSVILDEVIRDLLVENAEKIEKIRGLEGD